MVVYAVFLLSIYVYFALTAIKKKRKAAIVIAAITITLDLPIFGRIFGWW